MIHRTGKEKRPVRRCRAVVFNHGRHRARIVNVSETAFRVDIERQYDGIDADGYNRGKFWTPLGDWWSYADTVKRALEVAAENLRASDAAGLGLPPNRFRPLSLEPNNADGHSSA